ncbi:probetacellulin isoform X1 [Tachysurus fulvidraco]|uniref:probetacellulin isoform X1 n=1 Tax=Tachysurus fulvidraco TaxID=1234273 RepID=UPI000F4D318F|nr:probetacellulin isoform X1 [Tachysurus fulvidraco]XP_047661940.1 probetacellulin isoform X1 [Tachysurus fulvidraco]
MEKTHKLLLGIFTVALCKYSQAEWNTTKDTANKTVSCGPHDNSSNCTDLKDIHQWSGHFSKCPDDYLQYCIHGMCRFVQEQNTPTCRCESGYIGARCEYHDLGWLVGEQREIVIISIISGLVILLLIIVFVCICAHRKFYRKKRRKQKKRDEVERLNTLNTNEASPATGDVSDTNTV